MSYIPLSTRYDSMLYRPCGKSGLSLPLFSLGLWHNFGYKDSFSNMKELLTGAFDQGVTHFDLANNYGPPPGAAEENLGRVLREELKPYRDELLISTKAGYDMWPGPYGNWGSRKSLLASLDQSLKRLNLDYVDIFYSHRFDPHTPLEETLTALDQAVRSGKALYVGISRYSVAQTTQALQILRSLGTPCLIHQNSYSLLNRAMEEEGLDKVLIEEGVGAIAFSPLAQGQLSSRYLSGDIPQDSRAAQNGFLKKEQLGPAKISLLRELNDLAQKRGQTLAQMAIAWVAHNQAITSVLVGASRLEQLHENIQSLGNLDFSPEELDKIDALLSQSPEK